MMRKHSKQYDDYLKSDAWKAKREERLRLDDGKCVMCGRPQAILKSGHPAIQCHHINYNSLGAETMDSLVSVCSACHIKLHKYYARYRSWEDKERRQAETER